MPANNNMTDWEQQVRDKANSDVANNKLMRLNENPFFNSVAFHENPHAALADEAAHACAVGGSDMFSRQEGCDIHYGRAQIVDTLDYGTAADNYANLLDGLADLANRYGDKTFDSAVARYSKMDNLLPDYPESLAGDAAGPIRSLGRGLFVVSGGIQVTEDIADLVNGKPLEAVRSTAIFAASGVVGAAPSSPRVQLPTSVSLSQSAQQLARGLEPQQVGCSIGLALTSSRKAGFEPMTWVLAGVFTFIVIVVVYLRFKVSSQAGPVDRSELQGAYWLAIKRLVVVAILLWVLYLFAGLVLRW